MVATAADPADQFAFEFASAAQSTSSHFHHLWIASHGQPQPQEMGWGCPNSVTLKYRQPSCLYMNILFVCNQGKNRSKTAAQLFSGRFQTASSGLYSHTPVTESQLSQADVIVVMEEKHRTEIAKRFPLIYMQKQILVLETSDVYRYGQPELVQLLKIRISELLSGSVPFIE